MSPSYFAIPIQMLLFFSLVAVLGNACFYQFKLCKLRLGSGYFPSQLIRQGRLKGLRDQVYGRDDLLSKSVLMLLDMQGDSQSQRSEALQLWLNREKQISLVQLKRFVKLVSVIALLAVLPVIWSQMTVEGHFTPLVIQGNEFMPALGLTTFGVVMAILVGVFFSAFQYWINSYFVKLERILKGMNDAMSVAQRDHLHWRGASVELHSVDVSDAWGLVH